MGWVILLALGALVALALRLARIGRGTWWLAGAALMLGAAGYAWQGRPGLPGKPVQAKAASGDVDDDLAELRGALFGRFTADQAFALGSDAYARGGDLRGATDYVLAGIRQNPKSVMLWSDLGLVLTQHDGDTLSPAASFAFRRAIALSPQHPGPYVFLGLAAIRAGEFARARAAWAYAVGLTPANASYRAGLVERLALLDQLTGAGTGVDRR